MNGLLITRLVDGAREYVGVTAGGDHDLFGRTLGWTANRIRALVWTRQEIALIALQAWEAGELLSRDQEAEALLEDVSRLAAVSDAAYETWDKAREAWINGSEGDGPLQVAMDAARQAYRVARARRDVAERQREIAGAQRRRGVDTIYAWQPVKGCRHNGTCTATGAFSCVHADGLATNPDTMERGWKCGCEPCHVVGC